MKVNYFAIPLAALLLTACGDSSIAESDSMICIKNSTFYSTVSDMYANPDSYVGKTYHLTGQLHISESDDETIYSIYREENGSQIGIELDWNDFSGLEHDDTITVEGKLETESGFHHEQTVEYLVLRVTMLKAKSQSDGGVS